MLPLLFFAFSLTASPAAASNCAGGYATVCASACAFTTISAAVAAVPASPLTGDYCIDIRDNATYAEQVTVQGKSPGNFQIIIGTTTGAAVPTVSPPAASTAAFQVLNTSVAIIGIRIAPTVAVPYGVYASSSYLTMSSIRITDNAGNIKTAGVSIAGNWSTLANSTVTVQNAYGVNLNSTSGTLLSYSTVSANTSPLAALYDAGSSNIIANSFFSNPAGNGVTLDFPASNESIVLSTITSASSSADALLLVSGTSSDTIQASYVANYGGGVGLHLHGGNHTVLSSRLYAPGGSPAYSLYLSDGHMTIIGDALLGSGMRTDPGSVSNSISQTTIPYLWLYGSSSNTITQCVITSLSSDGADFSGASNFNTIAFSTIAANGAGGLGLSLVASASNTFVNDYIAGPTGASFTGSDGNLIAASVVVANDPAGIGVAVSAGSGVTLTSDTISALGTSPGSSAVQLQAGNSGTLRLSTNVLAGGQYTVSIATQAAGTQVWLASNTIVPALSNASDTAGLYVNGLLTGATIQNNAVVWRQRGSQTGYTAYGLYEQSSSGINFDHNRVDLPGLLTAGSFAAAAFNGSSQTSFKFNDVNSTGAALANAYLVQLVNGSTVTIRDNVFLSSFSVTGSSASLYVDAVSGFSADYNDWFSSTSANALVWGAKAYAFPWSGAVGADVHSIAGNPLWNNAGAGVEDFHPRSSAGRYVPQSGIFVQDAADSPTIDAADPAEGYGNEPVPNGFTTNQGSYGNTAQASKTAPAQNPSVVAVAISSVTLTWASARSPATIGYVVQASTASDYSGAVFSSATSNSSLTQLAVQGLNGSTTYFLRLGTTYSGGNTYVNATPSAVDTFAVPAVGGKVYAVWPTSITLNWVALSSQAISYDIEASSDPAFGGVYASSATAGLTQSTLTVTNLAIDATFYFRIGTFNWGGAATYAVVGSTYLGTPPIAIANLAPVASTGADTQAILSWTAPGAVWNLGTAASYNIRYSQSLITPGNFGSASVWKASRAVSGPVGTAETETIAGLTSGVTYYFALETANSSGSVSGLSNVVSYLTGQDVLAFVRSVTPSAGPAVSISTTVAVVFSKNVSTSTLAGVTVTAVLDNLGNPINQPVAGTTNYTQASETVVFSPAAPLTKNYTYAVQIATTVKDTFGNAVAASSAAFATIFDHTLPNVVSAGQGAQFVLPAGAFSADGLVTASTSAQTAAVQAATQKLLAIDRFANPVTVLNFSASDLSSNPLQPSTPLAVTLPFSSTVKPGFVDNTNPPVRVDMLALWWLDPTTQSWVRLPGSSANAATGKLAATVPHFSTFALIGSQDASLSNAFAFPVPYVPSKQSTRVITFQNLSSAGSIRIFTVSGKLVRELDFNDGSGQATWDAKNSAGRDAASGLYLYVIQSSAETKKGELIIVR